MSNKEQNRSTGSNRDSIGIPAGFSSGNRPGFAMPVGVYVGRVVDVADGDYGGAIHVQLVNNQKWGATDTREDRQKFTKVLHLVVQLLVLMLQLHMEQVFRPLPLVLKY